MGELIFKQGSIIDLLDNFDCIVNSNNQNMLQGSGVCGAIYKAAGPKELKNYIDQNFNTPMSVGEVRSTPGFNLKKEILHVHPPKFHQSKDPIHELLESYENVIKYAYCHKIKSLITVSLGTGVYGYNHIDVAEQVVNKLLLLVQKYDITVCLDLPDKKTMDVYKQYV